MNIAEIAILFTCYSYLRSDETLMTFIENLQVLILEYFLISLAS